MRSGPTAHDAAAIDATLAKAAALARGGRLRAAIEMLERDRGASRHPAGCNALGMLLSQSGSDSAALRWFDKAVTLAPAFADAHNNRGVALQQLGRLVEALAAFRRTLDIAPGHVNALMNSGNVLQLLGRDAEALEVFDRILAAKPDLAEAALKRAYVHMARKEHTDSLRDFETVLRLQPGHGGAAFGRVSALISLRRFEEALTVLDDMLARRPDDGKALIARGQVLIEVERAEEALMVAEDLLARGEGGSKADIIKAAALWRLGRHAEAVAVADDAGRRHPDDVQIKQALSQYYLATGDFARGWDAYEFRAGTFDAKQAPLEKLAPRWTGEDVADKSVLVFSEQGIGDTIQFARFLTDLSSRGARVEALVQPALLSLIRSLPAPVGWFDQARAVGRFDYQIPLLSLPRVLGTRLDSIPTSVPYLTPAPEKVAEWRATIGGKGFRIGVVWQGNPRYAQDHRRSVPLSHYAALARVPGVRLISLQAVHGLDQLGHLPEGMTVEALGEKVTANPDGISEIAAAMAAVDLVVSSDTAMAHLAGALGRPVWVALSHQPDWRWLFEREDSPWYPTMRLFRQTTRGDWQDVFARMAAALRERVG